MLWCRPPAGAARVAAGASTDVHALAVPCRKTATHGRQCRNKGWRQWPAPPQRFLAGSRWCCSLAATRCEGLRRVEMGRGPAAWARAWLQRMTSGSSTAIPALGKGPDSLMTRGMSWRMRNRTMLSDLIVTSDLWTGQRSLNTSCGANAGFLARPLKELGQEADQGGHLREGWHMPFHDNLRVARAVDLELEVRLSAQRLFYNPCRWASNGIWWWRCYKYTDLQVSSISCTCRATSLRGGTSVTCSSI